MKKGIYLGDAYELIKQIPDKSIDLILTDPPYVLDPIAGGVGFRGGVFDPIKKN